MRVLIVFLLGLFCSCKSGNELEFQLKCDKYVDNNFDNYSDIYHQINNWIDEMKEGRREVAQSYIFSPNYKVDKFLLMNEDSTKLVGIISESHTNLKNCTHDWINMIWGIKVKGEWHFLKGGNLFVPREYYKYDINEALSHYQLSYIGRDYFLKSFLHIEGDKISINSDLINTHVSLKDHKSQKDTDKTWLEYINKQNLKVIDSLKFKKIQDNFENDVHKDAVLPKKGTKAWTELYGTKTPLFERKEWQDLERK